MPVETAIQEGFKRDARQKLRERPDLTTIGITGSYGKTSTKFILAELLKQRYSVLATPGSYNTPMGLSLVVNQKLKREHQMLVLEYGIRHPGDMPELGEVARPNVAVVTTVGLAHLETMGSQENIAREKGALLDLLPPDGVAVLMMTAESWEVASSLPISTVALLSAFALLCTSAYLLKAQRLLARPGDSALREQRAVSNVSTAIAVALGMAVTYVAILTLAYLAGLALFRDALLWDWVGADTELPPPIRLLMAGFTAALSIIIGALGASFEPHGYFRHVTHIDDEI